MSHAVSFKLLEGLRKCYLVSLDSQLWDMRHGGFFRAQLAPASKHSIVGQAMSEQQLSIKYEQINIQNI